MSGSQPRKYTLDIIVVLIVVVIGYLGYKVVPTYVNHYRLKNGVHDLIVATARQTDATVLKGEVRGVAERFGLELLDDDVIVERDTQGLDVRFTYQREISVPFRAKGIVLNFEVSDSKEYNMW